MHANANKQPPVAYVLNRIDIDPITECWRWTRCLNQNGYGNMTRRQKKFLAHIFSFEAFIGPVPDGRELDHLCRNPKCCNPEHLEPVTHAVNMRRGNGGAKQRAQTHCKRGHEFTPENTYINATSGSRQCRACTAAWHKDAKARKNILLTT